MEGKTLREINKKILRDYVEGISGRNEIYNSLGGILDKNYPEDSYLLFRGLEEIINTSLLYFKENFKDVCFILPDNNAENYSTIIWNSNGVYIESQKFSDNFKRCFNKKNKKKKYVVAHLTLFLDDESIHSVHSNILIFDNKNKIMTRFEPHGKYLQIKELFTDKVINQDLRDMLSHPAIESIIGKGWKYESPLDFSTEIGPQYLENIYGSPTKKNETKGYCLAWSFLFLHLKFLNPELSNKQIIKDMVSNGPIEIKKIIKDYASFLVENLFKYKKSSEKYMNLMNTYFPKE